MLALLFGSKYEGPSYFEPQMRWLSSGIRLIHEPHPCRVVASNVQICSRQICHPGHLLM